MIRRQVSAPHQAAPERHLPRRRMPPLDQPPSLRSRCRSLLVAASVCFLVMGGCATTEEQRLPLNLTAGLRAAMQPGTAAEAFQAYKRMGADLERQGRFDEAAIAYSNAFPSARALGRLQDALEMAQKAVAMAERARNPRLLPPALIRLGRTYMDVNAPQRAIPILEKAARLAGENRNLNAESGSYIWLSRAYRRLGRADLARQSIEKAVTILESAILRAQSGQGRRRPGRQDQLWNMEQNYAEALVDLGWDYLALRQTDTAQTTFLKALEAGSQVEKPHATAQAQLGLGRIAAEQGASEAAVAHLQEALRVWQEPSFVAATERLLGSMYRQMGNLPEAEKYLRSSVAGIEDMRSQLQSEESREGFVEDKMGAYGLLIQTLFDQRKLAEAFDMSERARARAFLDLLGNRVSLSKGRSAALIAEEKALQERIAGLKTRETLQGSEEDLGKETARPGQPALQRELDLAREAYGAFLARVRTQSREQASLMTVEPLTLSEVQALLGPQTVLLEYFVGGGRTLAWVVRRNSLRAFRLGIAETELSRRVSRFRELIASRGRDEELQQAAVGLYQSLLAPAFRAGLPHELIIVPHRVLHYLPFHALMSAPDRYVLQDSLVSYLSSASLMQFTREKEQAVTTGALAVGNPDLEDPTLNLFYAEREVREVGRLFPGATVLVRKEATKARTRRSMGESLIHLATHADLDADDPLGSALLLRPEGSDTGRLEVQEVFGLDLHASLVILSACDTSLGKVTEGDEVVGLTRAFIYAGTPSVISTLWMVDDRSSYELMRAFYQNLQSGQAKGEALRGAQIATLQKYPHPYYWAAYQLTGEAR